MTAVALRAPDPGGSAGRDRPRSPVMLITIGLAAAVAVSHIEAAVGAFAGGSPALAAALVAVAAAAGLWTVRVARRPARSTLLAGAAGAAALVAMWATTRTIGVPLGLAERAPVGVLDALTALDELLLTGFAITAADVQRGLRERWSAVGSIAISLSFIALATGCGPAVAPTTASAGASPSAAVALLCHLY
jgi:hypothetical protein